MTHEWATISSSATAVRKRNSGNGATRKLLVRESRPRSFAWVNRLFVLLGLGVVLAATAKAALVLNAIPVERIIVTGKLEHTQKLALQEMVQPVLVGGFIGADLGRIQNQLQQLPWVYRAIVKRQWPNALEINVVEQLPIARWGESSFLNHEGEAFHPAIESNWDSLPVLKGIDGQERELIKAYQFISESLRPLALTVTELTSNNRGQLRAVISGGTELLLGSKDFSERLDRFAILYRAEGETMNTAIERVDLRYQSGLAVVFSEPPAVAGL
ncbi:MAG: cell division protein FtsQ [Halioglobus sp.]|jgi:cell division protein FtsQ